MERSIDVRSRRWPLCGLLIGCGGPCRALCATRSSRPMCYRSGGLPRWSHRPPPEVCRSLPKFRRRSLHWCHLDECTMLRSAMLSRACPSFALHRTLLRSLAPSPCCLFPSLRVPFTPPLPSPPHPLPAPPLPSLSPLPQLCQDWAHPPATSAPGLGSPRPHLHRDRAALSLSGPRAYPRWRSRPTPCRTERRCSWRACRATYIMICNILHPQCGPCAPCAAATSPPRAEHCLHCHA